MTIGKLRRLLRAIADSFRVQRAFSAAAKQQTSYALEILQSLGEDTKDLYDVLLLKGALHSRVGLHTTAVQELVLAAQHVRAYKHLSDAEKNYLVAYAVQYWEYSADQIGLTKVPAETRDAIHVDSPIVLGEIRSHLRKKFPLNFEFSGIEIRS